MNVYKSATLKREIQNRTNVLNIKLGEKRILEMQLQKAVDELAKTKDDLQLFEQVTVLLQKTSDFARKQAKTKIEEIVTSALSVVFDANYRFWLELTVRSNRPEVDYYLQNDDVITKLEQPDFGHGGGIIDVITLALRLAIAELEGVQGALFLDEVGKHISAEYSQNVAFFLKEYAGKFHRQIILVTHNETLASVGERSFHVTYNNKSEVKVV